MRRSLPAHAVGMRAEFWGVGFRGLDVLGLKVQSLGFRVYGLGLCGLGFTLPLPDINPKP